MKKCCELDSGLSVVETKLGNTVIGMLDDVCHIDRNVMTTLSMYVRNFKLTDLWSLESLGISNPTLEESKQNSYEDALNDFQQKLAILLTEENDLKVTLLRSKARVAPLKSLTIPRLELMSCCLGARLANSIIRALNLPGIKVIYWSDSEVALWWIREQGNWSVFVANRVKEIRELTQFQSWRHVPSNMNIADLLSRGCTPQKMLDSKWWEGPRWLRNNREQWPANKINCEPKDVILEKRKSELVNVNISEELVPCSNSPMSEPVSLPADRVKDANAFDITGIDLAGPLFTRDGGKAILTYEELLTVLCDCEAVVNSRPLTYVSEDPNDLIPLTPSLFLNGKSSYDTVDLDLSEFSKFQKRIKYRRKLINDFRSRFRKEYLGQLRQKRPGKPGHDFKVGDVVMIEEPSRSACIGL
ncbi:DUF5641 domain-containing protein [Trichonephila clavipes]|nr:DUF5641 domain-containing protein [Trichonephila clavipes]